jgi:YesN/AraC family two-component response regulator
MITVLYVDDEIINLELFRMAYKSDFYVVQALSGHDALDVLENQIIDVIVTDLKMPEMDGIELIFKIKEKYPTKKCILLTGYFEIGLAENPNIKEIVHSYMSKPFKKEELKQIITSAAC